MQSTSTITSLDYSGIILFFLVMIASGLFFFFKTRNTKDFFAGGRMVPGWISGLSFFMTGYSAMIFVGFASVAYRFGGWSFFVLIPSMLITPLVSIPIAGRWQRTQVTTVPEYLDQRFGSSTRFFFAFIGIPSRILDNSNRIYTTAVFIGASLGIGKSVGLWGSSFIILMYTFMGGIWAVLATDTLQFFLMTIAVIITTVLGLHFIGGFDRFVSGAPEGFWSFQPNDEFTITFAFALVIIGFINNNGYWALIQRYTAVPTEREARRVPIISGIATLVVMTILFFPPMIARQVIPHKINALVESGMSLKLAAERSYALICMEMLPAGIMGLMIIGIFAATMSALSSEYNIISAVCTKDLYQGLLKKGKEISERKLLWVGRLSTIVVAVLCTVFGSQIDKLGGAFVFVFTLLGLPSAPTYLPALMGLYFRKTPAWGANLSFILGLVAGILMKFVFQESLFVTVVINSLVTIATFLVAGMIDPVKGGQKERVDKLYQRLTRRSEEKEGEDSVPRGERPDLNLVITIGCVIFGVFLIAAGFISGGKGFIPNLVSGLCMIAIAGVIQLFSRLLRR
jgi:SSS family transporter